MPKGERLESSAYAHFIAIKTYQNGMMLYQAGAEEHTNTDDPMTLMQLGMSAFIQVAIDAYGSMLRETAEGAVLEEGDPSDPVEAVTEAGVKNVLIIMAQTLLNVSDETHDMDAVIEYVDALARTLNGEMATRIRVPAQTH